MSAFRTVVHDSVIAEIAAENAQIAAGLVNAGEQIERDVQARTEGSSTIRPFGRMMSVDELDGFVRVGTSWGPAVPVEYGTDDTPAQRVLLAAAEANGRVEFS